MPACRLAGFVRPPFAPALLLACLLPMAAAAVRAEPAITPPAAQPTEIWINLGGFSRHIGSDRRYNENNLGFGIEWRRWPELAVMAGVYDNSVGKSSQYAALNWQPWQFGQVKLGAAVGLLNGYPAMNRGSTFFAAIPMATIEGRRFGVNIGAIPSIRNVQGAVLVQFKVRIH